MKLSHVLRNFLYLDRQMVDDFLAGIEIGLYEEEQVKLTKEKGGSITGKGGVPFLSGEVEGELRKSEEITKQVIMTDAAKFQRLYGHLEKEKAFEYYESVNPDIWSSFGKDSLLEAGVTISFSNMDAMADTVSNLSNLASLVESFTGESVLDENSKVTIQGVKGVAKMQAEKGIPAKMTFIGSPGFTLVTYLNPDSLRVDRAQVVGEVTVLCKVQRMFSEGEKLDLFEPFGNLSFLNRKQRRELGKSKLPPEFRDTIKYPAAIVIPVAIYR